MEEENEENLWFKFVSGIDQQPGNLIVFQKVHYIVVRLNQVECVAYRAVYLSCLLWGFTTF